MKTGKLIQGVTLAATALLALSTIPARAGEKVGNGGQGVFCPGKAPVVLDYFEVGLRRYGGTPVLVNVDQLTEEQFVTLVEGRLKSFPRFVAEFQNTKAALGAMTDWIYTDQLPLRLTDDSAEAYEIPSGCLKQQLAVRQGNDVYLADGLVSRMTKGQAGVLWVHEILYSIATSHGRSTSKEVRQLMTELLVEIPDEARLAQRISALGGDPTTQAYLDQQKQNERRLTENRNKLMPLIRQAVFEATQNPRVISDERFYIKTISNLPSVDSYNNGDSYFLANGRDASTSEWLGLVKFNGLIEADQVDKLSSLWNQFITILDGKIKKETGCPLVEEGLGLSWISEIKYFYYDVERSISVDCLKP